MGRWTNVTGDFGVHSAELFTGAFAARATSTGSASYAHGLIGAPSAEVLMSLRSKLLSASTNVYLMKLRTETGGSILGVYRRSSTGVLSLRNDAAGASYSPADSLAVSLNEWHHLELRARIAGAQGETEVWLDGTRVDALSLSADLGTTEVGRLQLGDNSARRTFEVCFDDILVDWDRRSGPGRDPTETRA